LDRGRQRRHLVHESRPIENDGRLGNNKTNSEKISRTQGSPYGDAAVATYKDTYDAMFKGEHRTRTVISTDTFVKIGGEWKQVAGHASQAK